MMKKYLLISVILLFPFFSFSQVYTGNDADKLAKGAKMVKMKDYSKIPSYILFNDNYNLTVSESIDYLKSWVRKNSVNFELKSTQKDAGNEKTYRYYQTYNNIPIMFSSLVIHEKDGKVFAMNGEILDNPEVNGEFTVSPEQALKYALNYVKGEHYMWEDEEQESLLKQFMDDSSATYYPKGERVIVPDHVYFDKSVLKTAYKFNIYVKEPYKRSDVYVDAVNGTILLDLPTMYQIDTVGIAYTQYSGVRQINTQSSGNIYILMDNTRGNGIRTLNVRMTTNYSSAVNFKDSDNVWNNVNASLDEYATDAHFATMSTYDYYNNVHNRNSIDGNGYRLWSYVHFNLVATGNYSNNINAFWNGNCMTYGDGNIANGISPLTTVDITAHEITHGLTSNTCDLVYQDESGALNEAFSDIFGCSVEYYADSSTANWSMGEKIGTIFRNLDNPKLKNYPDTYHGVYWYFGTSDNGGVHYNSTVFAHWFYLLCEGGSGTNDLGMNYAVPAIGRSKAERIVYRLQTVYLTSTSDYSDAAFYGIRAAVDLFGVCSPEVNAVINAFYAIGIVEHSQNETIASFSVNKTEACDAPLTVDFYNHSYNALSYRWNFGDGTTSTQQFPSHTYRTQGTFSVSLIASGNECGVDTLLMDSLIVINPSVMCSYTAPENGSMTITDCSGVLYDCGGENEPYQNGANSMVVIHAPGADSIRLSILELDIEEGSESGVCDYDYLAFYDGNSLSSPLINNTYYCNGTGNPGTISSTGEYITIYLHSDTYVNLSGFKILFSCMGDNIEPVVDFVADDNDDCSGVVSFTDISFYNPTSWLWNFGDGTSSTEQNPVHHYFFNGQYSVSLTATNAYGSNQLIKSRAVKVDMADAPLIDSVIACNNQSFSVDVNVEGTALWYEHPADTVPVLTGNSQLFDPISDVVTYYVREQSNSTQYTGGENIGHCGPNYTTTLNPTRYLLFNAFQNFILESVVVKADSAGTQQIILRNQSSEIIAQKDVYCPAGVSRISLDFEVPAGVGYRLGANNSTGLYWSGVEDSIHFPYLIQDVLSIEGSSYSGAGQSYYFYFYDWIIHTVPCLSSAAVVVMNPQICSDIESYVNNDDMCIYPNPTTGRFTIKLKDADKQFYFIHELNGKVVQSGILPNENEIDISSLAKGIYFITIPSYTEKRTFKIIKM